MKVGREDWAEVGPRTNARFAWVEWEREEMKPKDQSWTQASPPGASPSATTVLASVRTIHPAASPGSVLGSRS